jgi:hypothetical protein
MSLQDWVRNAWLVPLKTSREEIQNLLGIVERDLRDSRAEGISNDWRFAIAYNAALQAAAAALAAAGFRASRDSHHYRVIQSLELHRRERCQVRSQLRCVPQETKREQLRRRRRNFRPRGCRNDGARGISVSGRRAVDSCEPPSAFVTYGEARARRGPAISVSH